MGLNNEFLSVGVPVVCTSLAEQFQAEQKEIGNQIWFGLGEEKKEFSTFSLLEAVVTLHSICLKNLLTPIKCGIF